MRTLVDIRKEFQPPWIPGAKAANARENLNRAARGEKPGKWQGPIARRVDRAKDYARREATARAKVLEEELAEAVRNPKPSANTSPLAAALGERAKTEGRKVAGKAAIGSAVGGGALLATTAGAAALGSRAAAKRAAVRSRRANKRLAAVVVPSTALAAGGGTLVAARSNTRQPER